MAHHQNQHGNDRSNGNNSSSNNNNNSKSSHSRSSRGPRGLLRRYANVEHVIVEEPFRLYPPHDGSGSSGRNHKSISSHNNSSHNRSPNNHNTTTTTTTSNNKAAAGDGCYVSATVQNRRYYGVLVDQAALKTASELWFTKEAESLDLNRRMKQLYQAQQQQKKKNNDNNNESENNNMVAVQEMATTTDDEKAPQNDQRTAVTKPESTTTTTIDNHNHNKQSVAVDDTDGDKKRKAETVTNINNQNVVEEEVDDDHDKADAKRMKLNLNDGTRKDDDNDQNDTKPSSTTASSSSSSSSLPPTITKNPPTVPTPSRPVQKFKYIPPAAAATSFSTTTAAAASVATSHPIQHAPGYRIWLATYADLTAAIQDHPTQIRQAIQDACQSGGNFVGEFYYQYESVPNTLQSTNTNSSTTAAATAYEVDDVVRMSMGFETFLRETMLPSWFPLSNLEGGGTPKVLSMLSMKRNHKGGLVWDDPMLPDAMTSAAAGAGAATSNSSMLSGTHVPMTPRSKYRIGILGGGIAGLACAEELLRSCDRDMIDVEVVLLEGRDRLGGRLWTDMETFGSTNENGNTSTTATETTAANTITRLAVDLGASWIHGIDDNPLAAVAREAGTHFVTVSDEVMMVGQGMQVIDKDCDERMGKIFDDILEQAADDCWAAEDNVSPLTRNQKAVRWYAAALLQSNLARATASPESHTSLLTPTDVPEHRYSSDITIDHAIGAEIAKRRRGQFAKLTKEDQRVLLWNTKSMESNLGANITDLSLKFWENDERHAFEGDHVVLTEGYSTVIQHMLENLKRKGGRFKCILNFEVGKVEYARKSTTQPYADRSGRQRKFIELSDTCCVTSQDESQSFMFDFVICTVPLGVLKESISTTETSSNHRTLAFQPPLPYSKVDSICNVGFGLLNKLYLQFPKPFWRQLLEIDEAQVIFGNASGFKPQHYMFFDVGKALVSDSNPPAVLMTLISGKDAVDAEKKSDEEIVQSVMQSLQRLFSNITVPQPIAIRITRWGSDKFSRGSHTFLPPGATDQDFQILQSPINGNGDSLLLDGSETMRLFFAGEHTTALHPSTAHGALLSGIRAGKEVVNTIKLNFNDEIIDRLIPLALFRKINPGASLNCNMCHLVGSRVREGTLLAFKRGARQVLAHNNCAENSPEVGVTDGRWTHVIKAVNRGKVMMCTLCKKNGATIGCSFQSCFRVYHFSCGEDTGWRFERDGKEFFCDMHRSHEDAEPNECDRISLEYCRSKVGGVTARCVLCGQGEDCARLGELLTFQRHRKQVIVHEKCARYTSVVDTSEAESRIDHEFRNVFEAAELAKSCSACGKNGATIVCSDSRCKTCLHFGCAEDSGWNFEKKGSIFKCNKHRGTLRRLRKHDKDEANGEQPKAGGIFQHALFAVGQDHPKGRPLSFEKPANSDIGALFPAEATQWNTESQSDAESSDSEIESNDSGDEGCDVMHLPVAAPRSMLTVDPSCFDFFRPALDAAWNVTLRVSRPSTTAPCNISFDSIVANAKSSKGLVLSLNGVPLGSNPLMTVKDVVGLLQRETLVKVDFLEGNDAGL